MAVRTRRDEGDVLVVEESPEAYSYQYRRGSHTARTLCLTGAGSLEGTLTNVARHRRRHGRAVGLLTPCTLPPRSPRGSSPGSRTYSISRPYAIPWRKSQRSSNG